MRIKLIQRLHAIIIMPGVIRPLLQSIVLCVQSVTLLNYIKKDTLILIFNNRSPNIAQHKAKSFTDPFYSLPM